MAMQTLEILPILKNVCTLQTKSQKSLYDLQKLEPPLQFLDTVADFDDRGT